MNNKQEILTVEEIKKGRQISEAFEAFARGEKIDPELEKEVTASIKKHITWFEDQDAEKIHSSIPSAL